MSCSFSVCFGDCAWQGLNFYRRACEAGVDAQCRTVIGTVRKYLNTSQLLALVSNHSRELY